MVSCVTRATAHNNMVEGEALYPLAVAWWSSSLGFWTLLRKHGLKKPKKPLWVWRTQKRLDLNEAGRRSKGVALAVSRACSWELTR